MRYKRNDEFQLKSIANEYVLIARGAKAIDFSSVVVFNETGLFLWQNMETFHTVEDLAEMLQIEWDVSTEEALRDVSAFLEKMIAENMVVKEEERS